MAIVVPFLVSYGATAMGVAAATATTIATITSVAFQVTGINNKINKAASKVFGEDLVMIANVAGAVYGAVNGFNIGSGSDVTEAGGALSTKAMLDGTNAFGANSAANSFDLAGAAGAGIEPIATAGEAAGKAALDGTNAFGSNSATNSFNLAEQAGLPGASAPTAEQGVDLLKGSQSLGTDTKAVVDAGNASSAPQAGAAGQVAAGTNAASGQTLGAGNASQSAVTPPTIQKPSTTVLGAKSDSFFGKLLSNDKAVGALIQGVGGGLQSASNNKAKQEELEFQKKLRNSVPTLYVKGAQA